MNHNSSHKSLRDAQKRHYYSPANAPLRRIIMALAAIMIIIMLSMVFLYNSLSITVIHILRGSVGLCAIIFVILAAWLYYRINHAVIKERFGPHHKD